MANNRWLGAAQYTAQVQTITVTADDAATTYKVTIGAATISILGTGTGAANTAAALQAALSASTDPRFLEISWTNVAASAVITATANTIGTPFTMTTSVSGGAGTIGSPSTVTANSSPSDVDNALNWSNAAVPANGDVVTLDDSSVPLLWNLGTLSAVTLTSLTIAASFTGTIGLPEVNTSGSAPYEEYRSTYWAIGSTTTIIGNGTGGGSGRIKLDNGSVAASIIVLSMGSPIDANLEAFLWKGTSGSNTMTIDAGSVGIAVFGNEVATVTPLINNTGTVRCGTGTTLTTVTTYGGTTTLNSAATTVKMYGGNLVAYIGAITTLSVISGTAQYGGTSTITTLNVSVGATIDFSIDPRSKTVTNANFYNGSTLNDPLGSVTFTNPIALVDCTIGDVTLNLRRNLTLAIVYS